MKAKAQQILSFESEDTAGVKKDVPYYKSIGFPLMEKRAQKKSLFSIIKAMSPDEELAKSIEETLEWSQKLKIETPDI